MARWYYGATGNYQRKSIGCFGQAFKGFLWVVGAFWPLMVFGNQGWLTWLVFWPWFVLWVLGTVMAARERGRRGRG